MGSFPLVVKSCLWGETGAQTQRHLGPGCRNRTWRPAGAGRVGGAGWLQLLRQPFPPTPRHRPTRIRILRGGGREHGQENLPGWNLPAARVAEPKKQGKERRGGVPQRVCEEQDEATFTHLARCLLLRAARASTMMTFFLKSTAVLGSFDYCF